MTSGSYKKLLVAIRFCFIAFIILSIGWLIKQDVVLSGEFRIQSDYQTPSPFVMEIVPTQRTAITEDGVQIQSEPVYASLKYPRPFKTTDVTLSFENPDDLFVELGPQMLETESYQLQAVNHPTLNMLANEDSNWERVEEGNLYQKRSAVYNFVSEDQLYTGLPDKQTTGYYGVNWEQPYIPTMQAPNTLLVDTPLRGGHEFYFVTQSHSLSLQLDFQDINRVAGEDDVLITVADWDGNQLEEWSYADDGDSRELGETTEIRTANIELIGLDEPMVYLLKVKATDDIILHQIGGNIGYIVAKGRLHIAGGPDYISEFGADKIKTVEVVTNARQWSAVTSHRDTLQELRMTTEQLSLAEPHKEARYSMTPERRFLLDQGYPVFVEKGNVVLSGRGVFALKSSQYFSPTPWLIDHTTDPEILGLTYLLTNYRPPVVETDGIFSKTINVNLAEVFNPNKQLRFQLSIPDLKPEQSFVVTQIQAAFSSDPVTLTNCSEKIKRFIDREILKR